MTPIKKAVIIGGGPSGLATALHLKRANNIDVTIYELRPSSSSVIGGAIGIPSNGLLLLHRLGLYEDLARLANTAEEFVLHSTQKDKIVAVANFSGDAKEKMGFGYMRVKRSDLISVLSNAVQKEGIPVHYEKRIVSIEDQDSNVTAVFSDGTRHTADILLGCDGIHSGVRSLHIDSSIKPEYTGLSVMFSMLKRSQLPYDAPPITCFNTTFTTDGVFAVISCTASDDEVFWFFSGEVPVPESGEDGWEEHRRKEVQEVKTSIVDVLHQVEGRWGDFVRDLVRRTDKISFTPVYRIPLGKTWSRGRCLLMGDAAHALQPHAGQGTSMALEDVFVLSRVIKQNPNDSVKDLFRKYDAIRRPRITRIFTASEQNGQLWSKTGPWGLWLRQIMAWVVFSLSQVFGWKRGVIPIQDLVYDPEAES